MTSVQNATVSPDLLAAVNPARSTSKSSAEAAQDRFITLLVTQMKNQDPLNPMDNAQVTSQFAQLSTVTGIDKVNATLESLIGDMQGAQSLQSANLIGHGVLVPGSDMTLTDGQATFGVGLTESATRVPVTVRDANGLAVRKLELGPQDVGSVAYRWDGHTDSGAVAAAGQYTFDVAAVADSEKLTSTALSYGEVTSVARDGAGVRLEVSGVGPVNYSDVQQILLPPRSPT